MKKYFTLLLVMFSIPTFAQDYLDKIAEETCECLDKIPDTIATEAYTMKLGICMIEAANPYRKKLKKDFKIDMHKIETQGEALGELVGIKMLSFCPNIIITLSEKTNPQNDSEELTPKSVLGKITAVNENQFVSFSLKDGSGKTQKFYWLEYIESEIDLFAEYKNLKGKSVKITYKTIEFFDPRIGEYHNYNIILSIEKIRSSIGSQISMR